MFNTDLNGRHQNVDELSSSALEHLISSEAPVDR